MDTLGERLKKLREGRTQAWFAKQLGIPATTLSNYENGKSELNFAIIDIITTNFSVNTDWLLFGRGPMHKVPQAEQESPTNSGCERCRKLEQRLEATEEGRWKLSEENRLLLKENGALKIENLTLIHQLEVAGITRSEQP